MSMAVHCGESLLLPQATHIHTHAQTCSSQHLPYCLHSITPFSFVYSSVMHCLLVNVMNDIQTPHTHTHTNSRHISANSIWLARMCRKHIANENPILQLGFVFSSDHETRLIRSAGSAACRLPDCCDIILHLKEIPITISSRNKKYRLHRARARHVLHRARRPDTIRGLG